MSKMRTATVTAIGDHTERTRRIGRALAARRRLDAARGRRERGERRERERGGGRVWINGRELGGTDPRLAHLGWSFD